jgi:hypothetical protein
MKRGSKPYPRLRLNPELAKVVRKCGIKVYEVARRTGITHQSRVSSLIHATFVTGTPQAIDCLERIAAVVRFDPARLFIDDDKVVTPELRTAGAVQHDV